MDIHLWARVKFIAATMFIVISSVSVSSADSKQEGYILTHTYEIQVTNTDDVPIKNAEVKYRLGTIRNSDVPSERILTGPDGIFRKSISEAIDEGNKHMSSIFMYDIHADGYTTVSGNNKILASQSSETKVILVKMHGTKAYLDSKTFNINADVMDKSKIDNLIELISIKGMLAKSKLEDGSVTIKQYKNNNYLSFRFISTISNNSPTRDRYSIAKNTFEDLIRPILKVLNEFNNVFKPQYGYNFQAVEFYLDKWGVEAPIEYSFYIPQTAALAYKNNELSGQQLIDKSTILIDGDKIDLKLQ